MTGEKKRALLRTLACDAAYRAYFAKHTAFVQKDGLDAVASGVDDHQLVHAEPLSALLSLVSESALHKFTSTFDAARSDPVLATNEKELRALDVACELRRLLHEMDVSSRAAPLPLVGAVDDPDGLAELYE
jgi:hypothetical protein